MDITITSFILQPHNKVIIKVAAANYAEQYAMKWMLTDLVKFPLQFTLDIEPVLFIRDLPPPVTPG